MIQKLNLYTLAHPHPYNIQWLNQSQGLHVNSRCLISFSIGKNYQDELWFDVIPMDVLLGRPWLFDWKVMHNGYLNTYSFSKDGKKITLAYLAPPQLHKKAPEKNLKQLDLFLTFSEPLLKASIMSFKPLKSGFSQVMMDPKVHFLATPFAVPLLHKYAHVFLKEIPASVPPPKREI